MNDKALAPGVAEMAAALHIPPEVPPAPTTPRAPLAPPPEHVFIPGGKERQKIVPLDYPLHYAGHEWRQVVVKRLQVRDVVDYVDRVRDLQKVDPDGTVRYPMFVDDAGVDLPEELFGLFDDNDMLRLNEAAESFLPQRFRAMLVPDTTEAPASPTSGPPATSVAS